jgi:hypothetical protein
MPTPDTDPPGSIVIDVENAKAAYEALKPTHDAISHERLLNPRIDMQKEAAHAFGLTERDRAESRVAGFEKLAAAEIIGARPLDRYAQAALATWYARQQQVRFAAHGQGTVPPPVLESATLIKRRMLKIVEHYFADHPTYSVEIAAIRAGSGYQDTANDLQQLADLSEIEEIAAIISRDPVYYRDTDARDARAVAGEIFRALGFESTDSAEWSARVRRAYTHLHDTYSEHCRAGSLLFFRSERVELTYPTSLVSVVRLAPTRAGGAQDTTTTTGAPNSGAPTELDPPVPTDPSTV